MQETSELYQQILLSDDYYVETSLSIGEAGRLLTETGDVLLFGGDSVLLSGSGGDSGYGENMLISVKTTRRLFSHGVPEVGCCPCGEIYVEMHMPLGEIPPRARLMPYVRLVSASNPMVYSEWLRKGVFYIDTRENTRNDDGLDILTIHGYDAMLMADTLYTPDSDISFPAKDIEVVRNIAKQMGVAVDSRCVPYLNKAYEIQLPVQYTKREILGYIGAMYAGNWIMNDNGDLQLVTMYGLPEETSLLLDDHGFYITFGGDRIKL